MKSCLSITGDRGTKKISAFGKHLVFRFLTTGASLDVKLFTLTPRPFYCWTNLRIKRPSCIRRSTKAILS